MKSGTIMATLSAALLLTTGVLAQSLQPNFGGVCTVVVSASEANAEGSLILARNRPWFDFLYGVRPVDSAATTTRRPTASASETDSRTPTSARQPVDEPSMEGSQ
jgi:hypothetical protein